MMMMKARSACVVCVLAVATAVCLASCGGGGSKSTSTASANQVVAEVNGTPVTRAQVNHWMVALAGSDYYADSLHAAAPAGLVSDPPDYAHCAEQIEAAIRKGRGSVPETKTQILSRCRQLYQALRIQATGHIITTLRAIGLAREVGVSATSSEVQKRFTQATAREYPTQADYQRYLSSTRGSVSDGLLETKIGLLGDRVLEKLKTPAARARYLRAGQAWGSKITCQQGYVVEFCKQYAGGATYPGTPPPSVQMEQLAALITGQCTNLSACAKQAAKK